jgi:hypothetical protein
MVRLYSIMTRIYRISPVIIRQSAHRRPNSPGARYKHALPGRIATARSPVAQRYHKKFLKWICVLLVCNPDRHPYSSWGNVSQVYGTHLDVLPVLLVLLML